MGDELNECVTQEGPLLGQYESEVREEVDKVIAMAKEKRAVQIVAKVKADIQKMRMALPETLEATETKLREVLLEEIGNLGINEPQIHEEAEKAIEYAKKRAELLEAKRKKEEAARLAREKAQKEKDDRAAVLLAELEALVNGAS